MKLKKTFRENYLEIKCHGDLSDQNLQTIYASAIECADLENINAILLDLQDLEGPPLTAWQQYSLGKQIASCVHILARRIQFAIVSHISRMESEQFLETVAVNRGASIKVFFNVDDAAGWLKAH